MAKFVSSKHLEGVSDLTLIAPIRAGFTSAMESVTFETRLRLTMEALFKIRATAREHSAIKPFIDTAERIEALLAFRLAILDTKPRRLLLSATFDRPFEPYMRLIWKPLGRLLDLAFCNCEGYPSADESRFADYLAWVRASQVDSGFFYTASGSSVIDVRYLSELERLQREQPPSDSAATALVTSDVAEVAAKVRAAYPREAAALGGEVLVALHRLTDLYPPDRMATDGKYLLRATQDLLADWDPSGLPDPVRVALADKIAWFKLPVPTVTDGTEEPKFCDADVQAGILTSVDRTHAPMTHGALLLMGVSEPAQARAFIRLITPKQTQQDFADDTRAIPHGTIVQTVALTYCGLRNLGVPESELQRFPQEFREGMEDRAGLLGDLHDSHPRNWSLPERNWPPAATRDAPPIELSEVDVVIHLRMFSEYAGHAISEYHPLWAKITEIAEWGEAQGVTLLGVQPMRRATANIDERARGHFGFVDNLSQPAVATGGPPSRDDVRLGELLVGYANDRDDPAGGDTALLHNGTFLVVRKLRQNVTRFKKFIDDACAAQDGPPRDTLLGKLIGRTLDGDPLVPPNPAGPNEFTYEEDKKGEACPFQAHIRRANPRVATHGRPNPRIMRRGMSYGPVGDEASDEERGLIFLAYNASIAEQFEVIQRWINGGNSTGVLSGQGDPLIGLGSPRDDPRTFRFLLDGKPTRIKMNPPTDPCEPALVELAWGSYLFVPSLTALSMIAQGFDNPEADEAARGEALIAETAHLSEADQALAWKTWLEDFAAKDPVRQNETAAIWAAIRSRGGAIRVPYGDPASSEDPCTSHVVLAASDSLVMRVLKESATFSMDGPAARMRNSFGDIYLGLDDTPDYWRKSTATNRLLMGVTQEQAFKVAYELAEGHLRALPALVSDPSGKADVIEFETREDFITWVLAGICRFWFGIPDGMPGQEAPCFFEAGGWSAVATARRRPHCPGDFMAPSRYCFYPDPVPAVRAYGAEQGRALTVAAEKYIAALGGRSGDDAPIARAIAVFFKDDPDEAARTLIGVMIGFLPPTDGCLRGILYEWLEEKTLWRIQRRLKAAGKPGDYACAAAALREPIARAIQKRPAPDMLWRRAKAPSMLGQVAVKPNDRVFVGIASAIAQACERDPADTSIDPVFGGRRGTERDDSYPLHACPAYDFAMGTMTGMLAALLDAGRLEALPSPRRRAMTQMLRLIRPRGDGA